METSTAAWNMLQTLFISLNVSTHTSYNTSEDNSSSPLANMTLLPGGLNVPFVWPTYLPLYVTIVNVIVFFTGTVGNVLVIVVVVLVKDMRTPMNWYLVNLSIADLLVLLVCQPAALAEFFAMDRWLLGPVLCKLVPFLEHTVLHASTLIILAITVERYYAICLPLKKMSICHKPHPLRVLPGLWAAAILTAVPFTFITHLVEDVFLADNTACYVCVTKVEFAWHYVFIIGMTLAFFVLPMVVLLYLYINIIRSLSTSGDSVRLRQVDDMSAMSTRRSRRQVIKMLVGIVILYFVSLMPVRGVIFWHSFAHPSQVLALGPERYYNLMWVCRIFMYVNSAGNPIIYSLISSRFQQAFYRLLKGRRKDPLSPKHRGSMSSRHSSITRYSLSGVQRTSLTPTNGSRVSLTPNNGSRLNSMDSGSRAGRSSIAMRFMRTQSASGWSVLDTSPQGSPFFKKQSSTGNFFKYPMPKQRSCTSIL